MAAINKLSIRGVRAFSPDGEEQVVEFSFPLTVISGRNGCGKTTIIESLKFALSGSMPPGGAARSAGQSFVHDPRSIGQSVVKANVKLRFTNKAGSSMVVIRSMEVTQKKTTMHFKQLDGVIRTMDAETGERVSLSHKCGELDKQIPSLLGVSKAILDYVLFVHQEDSSWPLQEASVLKKRFDDIFDSTRYTKALESFRKTKKELALKVKDIKAEVAEYASHKHAAKGFRKERELQNRNLQALEEEMEECDRVKTEAEADCARHFKIMEELNDLLERIAKKSNKKKSLQVVVQKQREMLDKDLTKELSKEALEEKLKDFDKEMRKETDRTAELQRKLQGYRSEIEELRQKEMKLNSSIGKVSAEKEAQDKRLSEQHTMMNKLALAYSLHLRQSMTQLGTDDSFVENQIEANALSKEDLESFMQDLKKKEKELKDNLQNHKTNTRNQEEEFNTALQELVGNKNALDNERKKLANETRDIDTEMQKLASSMPQKKVKKSVVDDARDQLKQAERHLSSLTSNDEREKLAAEIRSFNEKLDQIKDDIEAKQSAKVRLKSSAGLQAQVDVLKSTVEADARTLHESIENKRSELLNYTIDLPASLVDDPTIVAAVPEVIDSIDSKYQKAKRKAEKASQELEKARTKHAHESASFGSLRNSLTSLEKRRDALGKAGESVSKVKQVVRHMVDDFGYNCIWQVENDQPQALLDLLNNSILEMEDQSPEDIAPDVLAKVMKRIRKKGKADGLCPCCRRDFSGSEQKAFSEAVKELGDETCSPLIRGGDEEVQRYRSTRAKVEELRKTVTSCVNDLHEYKRILAEIADKRPKAEHNEVVLKESQKQVDRLRSEATDTKKHVDLLRDLHEISKRWREDAGRIEEQLSNIGDKEESLLCETAGSLGDGTLDEVEQTLQSLQENQSSLYEKISKKNKKISSINSEVTAAQTVALSRAELLRKKETQFQEDQKATKRKHFLDERKSTITRETSKLGEQIQSLQQKIRARESEKTRLYSHARDEENKQSDTLSQFSADIKRLVNLTKQIDEYANNDETACLAHIESEVAKAVAKIKEKEEQRAALQLELENSSRVLDDQERQKKVLRDNIDLHETEENLLTVQDELEELQKAQSAVDGGDTCHELMEEADKKKNECQTKKSRLSGRRAEMVEQMRSLQRKLQSPEYKNVDNQHREAEIKKQTTELAAADLDKYASALDKALLRFHSLKIADINKIIKELWLKCYQGNDITNIELESGQDSRAAKSYNYRVVMSKGNTKMDMRGRCSAGQRVLASIVIRLALAETFGIHCGCLVLDEPTVNLDEANRGALAQAMAQIIASRSAQSNFQLVLITHDEEFISLMKDELSTQTGFSMPEKYFMVRREECSPGKWYSKIDAVDWDDLL